MAGIVSLQRMIDKTRADAAGTLGEYDVDCPHDKPVLQFMGSGFSTFAANIKELDYDEATIDSWARSLLAKHTHQEVEAFNASRFAWVPDDDGMRKSLT